MHSMSIDPHEYRGQVDMEAMVELVRSTWRQSGPHMRFHVGDVYWWLCIQGRHTSDPNIRLWSDENGTAVGLAWFQPPAEADFLIRPDRRGRGVEGEILGWLEQCTRSRASRERRDLTLDIGSYGWESYLEGRGYARGDTGMHHFWRSLDSIPDVRPPPGYRVQGVRAEDEAAQ